MIHNVRPLLTFLLLMLLAASCAMAQEPSPDAVDKPLAFPDKLITGLHKKTKTLNERLQQQTVRYLDRMRRREQKMRRQLMQVDSTAAKTLFDDAQDKYTALTDKATRLSDQDPGAIRGEYLPYLDSLKGTLRFLDKHPQLRAQGGKSLTEPLKEVHRLQNNLHQSKEVQAFLQERKEQIGATLKRYTQLPKGLTKGYGEINKQAYYYKAQVQEYKAMWKDPSKREQQALALLRKVPAFQSFMQKHSMLAGLFAVPAGYGTPEALAGLQTREQVQQLIAGRIGSGPNSQGMLQQNLQAAQTQLSQLKDKINQLGGGSGELEMPDFVPNTQKTKTFMQRLEYSTNLQTVKNSRYFPTTSDIAINVGYKLNQKSVIGIGSSYRLGLGTGLRNIAFTHEGIGLRSYMDYKIKGSFWLTGGAEMNYRSRFSRVEVLKDYSAWQRSALVGLSKKYQVSKKVKGNAQILYDALWRQQTPRGNVVVFRVGYNLK